MTVMGRPIYNHPFALVSLKLVCIKSKFLVGPTVMLCTHLDPMLFEVYLTVTI